MKTQQVNAGNIAIGGGAPIRTQTMWKDPLTKDIDKVLERLSSLSGIGCSLVRFAVPDGDTAEVLSRISRTSPVPVVADIHYDYRLALSCIEGGVHKIRINPGNIGAPWKVQEVVKAAAARDIPIRVGVNSGSLPKELRREKDTASAMVKAAESEMEIFEKLSFHKLVYSLKSSDIETTVKANTLFSRTYSYPLHLGVTEAGPLIPGIVKSSVALSRLLKEGIGDTIRVSLSDSPESEVIAGMEILSASGIPISRPNLISCPRCGRSTFDTHEFVGKLAPYLYGMDTEASVAVMGCVVNGPGEAKEADLGITGAGKEIIIFRRGEIIKKVMREDALGEFVKELGQL
ncbi:MAG: flavodoxin-dependent (E)-4-hydroxy-3-methylbut-2-enyl-diphosphate synthase [Spirochaetia bacterium]